MVIREWIPACAESTPRIEKKCSGGNDGALREGQREAGTHAMMQGWIPVSGGECTTQGGITS